MSTIPQQNKPVYQGTPQAYDKLPQQVKQYYQRPPQTKLGGGPIKPSPPTPPTLTKTLSPLPPQTLTPPAGYVKYKQLSPEQQKSPEAKVAKVQAEEQAKSFTFYSQFAKPELAQKGYAAPQIPEGYEVTEVKEVYPPQVYGVTYGTKAKPSPSQPYVEVSLQQKKVFVPTQLFGPTAILQDPQTGEYYAAITASQKAPRLTQSTTSTKQISYLESRAMTGAELVSVVAVPVLIPKLIPFAVGAVGVAQVAKSTVGGGVLTPEEAISAAGVGELVGMGTIWAASKVNQKYVQPRVQRSLTESYEAQARLNEQYLREYGEPAGLWKPSVTQRVAMKLTGATPQRPAPSIVSMGGPSEVMVGGKPQIVGGLSIQRIKAMSESFDLSVAPATSGFMISKAPLQPVTSVVNPKLLPLYFGLGKGEVIRFKDVLMAEKSKQPPLEKGIPERITDYDYRGSLSFKKLKGEIARVPQEVSPMKTTLDLGAGDVTRAGTTTMPMTDQQAAQNIVSRYGKGIDVRADDLIQVVSTKTVTRLTQPTVKVPSLLRSTIPVTKTAISKAQVANPFLQFAGKPYYLQRGREEETEYVVVSTPQGALKQPERLETKINQTLRLFARQTQQPTVKLQISERLVPMALSSSTQALNQATKQLTGQVQQQKQTQTTTTPSIPKLKTVTTKLLTPPIIGAGGGGDITGGRRYGKGLWRKREHPIPTPEMVTNNLLGKRRRKR